MQSFFLLNLSWGVLWFLWLLWLCYQHFNVVILWLISYTVEVTSHQISKC